MTEKKIKTTAGIIYALLALAIVGVVLLGVLIWPF